MAKITFWCDEETSEVAASDSPYFLVYVGDASQGKSAVKRVRHASWDDNVDKGEPPRSATFTMPGINQFSLVLVALMEEDNDPDANLALKVQNWMDNLDGLLQPAIVTSSPVVTLMREEMKKAIENNWSNDDLVGVKRITSGQTLHYFGEGGHYRVRFEV